MSLVRRIPIPAVVAFAVTLALTAGAATSALAQTGVWRQVGPPGGDVTSVAHGDSGSVLLTGALGGFRYDGLRSRRVPVFAPGADSLSGSAILEAKNGDLWVASLLPGTDSNGLYRLRPDGSVERFTAASGLGNSLSDQVLDLAETPDGTIWAGVNNGGLSRFDGFAWTTITTDQGLPTMTVKSIAVDPVDGSLWVGTLGVNAGLAHIVDGVVVSVHRGFALSPQSDNVRAVLITRDREVWVGFDRGLARLAAGVFEEYDATTSVTALAEGAHGEIWFGTGNRGVGRWDVGQLRVVVSGPPSGVIRDLIVDAAGVLWVATAGGAARFEGAAWLTYSKVDLLPVTMSVFVGLRDFSVAAVGDSIDGDGIVWIGGSPTSVSPTQNLKLVRRANGRLSAIGTAEGLPGGPVRALAPADSGAIWCATATGAGGGVARVSVDGVVTHAYLAPTTFPSSNVFALADAGAGGAWAATQTGAVRVDRAGHATLPIRPGAMPDAPLVGVAVDALGRAWFATGQPPTGIDPRAAAGAVRFDPADSSYFVVDVAAGLPTNRLNGVTIGADGAVWLASPAGAIRWNDGAIRTFTFADGLPTNDVTGVGASPDGRIWAATAAGLASFDGTQWSTANVGDGLAGSQMAAVFADSLGVLAACGTDGISLYHPDRTPPRVEVASGPPSATGASTVQFALRGGDLDSDAGAVLISTELVGRTPTPFLPEVDVVALDLLDGDYVFRVRAKDRALNQTPAPIEWAFTVDATPPRPVIEQPAFNAIVKDTVDVLGRIVDPRFATYLVELRREGTVAWDTLFTSPVPPSPGAPLYRWTSRDVNDGVWELRVGVTDSLGLIGYSQVSVIVDNFAPSASVTAPAKVDHVTGGRVFTTNGEVELYVPPNAWSVDQIVRIEPLAVPVGGFPGARRPLAAWVLLADDPTLDKPATLSIALPPDPAPFPITGTPSIQRLVISGADTTLVPVGGARSADGARVTTTVDELGAFVLIDDSAASGGGFAGARSLDCQPRVLSPRGGGFDVQTAISFDLGRAGTGAVKVYDRAGRLVKEVAEVSAFAPGRNVVYWNGTDGDGQVVPSGLYTVAGRFAGATSVRPRGVANP